MITLSTAGRLLPKMAMAPAKSSGPKNDENFSMIEKNPKNSPDSGAGHMPA